MNDRCQLCKCTNDDGDEPIKCEIFADARRAPMWLRQRCLDAGPEGYTGMRVEQKRIGEYSWLVTIRDDAGVALAWAEAESREAALRQLLSAERYRERYGLSNDKLIQFLERELEQ